MNNQMNNLIKIGFTGNRTGLSDDQKEKIIQFLDQFDNNTNIIIHHGDCVGSDTDFHDICVNYRNDASKKISITIMPPDKTILRGFNKIDKSKGDILMPIKPYLERNNDIVHNSDIIIGCPLDASKEIIRSGTWSTIRKARKAKKIVHVY